MSQPILKLENLRTYFHTDIGVVKAVDDLNVEVQPGQTLGIVGESGSGKTTLMNSILGLYKPYKGKILLNGTILHTNFIDYCVYFFAR